MSSRPPRVSTSGANGRVLKSELENNPMSFPPRAAITPELFFLLRARNTLILPHSRTLKSFIASRSTTTLASICISMGCRSGQGGSRDQPAEDSPAHATPEIKARPLSNRSFERTPERLTRGRYLVNGIGECFGCHGPYE